MADGRNRPRRRRKEERPGEILEAAFEEFALKGFAATRLDDVAARVGITKGTIYVYFPSKEDLFLATVKQMCRPLTENLATLTAEPRGAAMEILRAHFRLLYDHLVADRRGRELLRVLIAEAGRFPTLADRWHSEVIGPVVEQLRDVVRYGVGRGEFVPTGAETFPHLLFAPVVMASTWCSLFGERQCLDVEGYRDTHLDLLARALCPASPDAPQPS